MNSEDLNKVMEPWSTGLSSRLQLYIDKGKLPGLQTLVVNKGEIIHSLVQGYSDRENGIPLRKDAIFRIFSMTKPITAVAVMILWEERAFDLDDPVSYYIPEFSGMQVITDTGLRDARQEITLRHLLSHTAGFVYKDIVNEAVRSRYLANSYHETYDRLSGISLEDYVTEMSGRPLVSSPGEEWNYSDGMSALARVVETVSEMPYGEFLKTRILEPLNMPDTGYYVKAEDKNRLAKLYEYDSGNRLKPVSIARSGGDYTKKPALEAGGSGLVSTAGDYLRFCQMLLKGGYLDGVRILREESVNLIFSDQLGEKSGEMPLRMLINPLTRRKGVGYGLGGLVVTDASKAGSEGANGEYTWGGWASTHFWIDRKNELIGILLTQLVPDGVTDVRAAFHRFVYQSLPRVSA